MLTKNLGQVAGLWIGNSAPENTSLIWYDNTPAIRAHKVYDFAVGAWVVLDKNSISVITYSELRNLARNTGLTQGSWYKVTDQGNILALAITTTKVQYVDINNNFVIDDLASNATYVVTSSNLLIDDIQGVWNATDKRLMFSFEDTVQDDNTANDYILGKKQRNNVWSLAKYKLSSLVSSVTGNSITWNKGFFFNFRKNLQDNTNVSGGVVGKDAYDTDKAALQQNIDNVAVSNQSILNSAKNYIDGKVTASEIYGKTLPSAPTTGIATDIASGDTLSSIVTKIQRWINQFKTAEGIKLSKNFAPAAPGQSVNNNDSVDTALRKLQGSVNNIPVIRSGEDVASGNEPFVNYDSQSGFSYTDNIFITLSKIISRFSLLNRNNLAAKSFMMPVHQEARQFTENGSIQIQDLIVDGKIKPIKIHSSTPITVTINFLNNLDIPQEYIRFQLVLISKNTTDSVGKSRKVILSGFSSAYYESGLTGHIEIDMTRSDMYDSLAKVVTFEIAVRDNRAYWSLVSISDSFKLNLLME